MAAPIPARAVTTGYSIKDMIMDSLTRSHLAKLSISSAGLLPVKSWEILEPRLSKREGELLSC